MGEPYASGVELASFHTVSKGFLGGWTFGGGGEGERLRDQCLGGWEQQCRANPTGNGWVRCLHAGRLSQPTKACAAAPAAAAFCQHSTAQHSSKQACHWPALQPWPSLAAALQASVGCAADMWSSPTSTPAPWRSCTRSPRVSGLWLAGWWVGVLADIAWLGDLNDCCMVGECWTCR